jgi:tRNA-uridine 2-sulfurtransferase
MKKIKALGLFSGGLDSWLAALILKRQGIDVFLLHIYSPFFGLNEEKLKKANKEIKEKGMSFIKYKVNEDYIDKVLNNPKYGYGSSCNACIDCHAYMLKIAFEVKKNKKFDFIFTGDVLGQRPMSQKKDSLNCVEKVYGVKKEILRPLSAKLLPVTYVEKKGFVDRAKLLDIKGRSRKQQIKLVKEFDLKNYLDPGGGCSFTDKNIKKKFFTLKKYFDLNWELISLIKIGRHFLLDEKNIFIVSRDEKEYFLLKKYFHLGLEVRPAKVSGAVGLVLNKKLTKIEKINIANVLSRYTKAKQNKESSVLITFIDKGKELETLKVNVLDKIPKEFVL